MAALYKLPAKIISLILSKLPSTNSRRLQGKRGMDTSTCISKGMLRYEIITVPAIITSDDICHP